MKLESAGEIRLPLRLQAAGRIILIEPARASIILQFVNSPKDRPEPFPGIRSILTEEGDK